MSHWRDFCTKGQGNRQFLVLINEHGEMGVGKFDAKGEIVSWAFDKSAIDACVGMLSELYPHATCYKNGEDIFAATGYECRTLDDLLAVLNGKSGVKKAKLQTLWRFTGKLDHLIEWDDDQEQYVALKSP